MKLVFKVILLFLIVFNLRIPYVYNTVFLSIILATLYYFFEKKFIPFTYFTYRHNIIILIATLVVALIAFSITTLHGEYSTGSIRRIFIQFSMLWALIYILPILFEEEKSDAYERAILLICYIFALQGFIHLLAYLIPPLGDYILSLKPESFQADLKNPARNIDQFRGYALSGSTFFELPGAYGVAFIMYVRLQLMKGQQYLTGYKSYIVLSFIVIGILLTGRTGFVGIGVGIGFYFLFAKDPVAILGRVIKNVIIFSPVLLIFWFWILSPSQRLAIENEIFPFAFEFYYRFRDTGLIATGSSDVTFNAFYFPLQDKTLLWGHGVDDIYGLLDMYSFTDAGYMRTLMFGGISYLIILLSYQFLYFLMPIKATFRNWERENKIDRYCFLFLFFYILGLHVKDTALGLQHLTEVLFLFIGFSYLIKYYTSLEK